MRFGLEDSDFEILRQLVLRPLWRAGATVWLFGSRARGDHKTFSDVDLLFDGPNLPPGVFAQIMEQIEQSRFPYKVDLVSLGNLASSYRSNVLKERILLEPS